MPKWIVPTLILAILVWLFFHFSRRKRQFRSIRKSFGIPEDNQYNLESITCLLLRFNKMVETPLMFSDYAIINIDGTTLLLLYGDVGFTSSGGIGIRADTRKAAYVVVEGDEVSKIIGKHKDLFESAMRKEDITIFWVRNLKKLDLYLREQQRSKGLSKG